MLTRALATVPPPSGVPLTALDTPPESPPWLVANGVEIPVVQYQWRSDDGWDRLEVGDPDSIQIPSIPADENLTMVVGTAARPQIATLYEFDDLDSSGHPVGDPAATYDCLAGPDCAAFQAEATTRFLVSSASGGRVLTLVLVYARAGEGADEPLEMMSASWVFHSR